MQLIGRIQLQTRLGEEDSFRHINNAHYLRYIEHGRVQLVVQDHNPLADLMHQGASFIVTRIEANFLFPLSHGRNIEVWTYAMDYHGVRGRFFQEIVDIESGRKAFQGVVQWVVMAANGRPLRVGQETERFIAKKHEKIKPTLSGELHEPPLFSTQKAKENLTRFYHNHINSSKIQPNQTGAIRHQMTTRFHELDSYRHVNNAVYFSYFEEARWHSFPYFGFKRDSAWNSRYTVILGSQLLNYRSQLGGQEPIYVETSVVSLSRAATLLHHTLFDKHKRLAADALAQVVFIEASSGKPAPWVEDLRRSLSDRLVDPPT